MPAHRCFLLSFLVGIDHGLTPGHFLVTTVHKTPAFNHVYKFCLCKGIKIRVGWIVLVLLRSSALQLCWDSRLSLCGVIFEGSGSLLSKQWSMRSWRFSFKCLRGDFNVGEMVKGFHINELRIHAMHWQVTCGFRTFLQDPDMGHPACCVGLQMSEPNSQIGSGLGGGGAWIVVECWGLALPPVIAFTLPCPSTCSLSPGPDRTSTNLGTWWGLQKEVASRRKTDFLPLPPATFPLQIISPCPLTFCSNCAAVCAPCSCLPFYFQMLVFALS